MILTGIAEQTIDQFNQTSFIDNIQQTLTNISPLNILVTLGQIILVAIIFFAINRSVSSLIERVQDRRNIERRVTRQIQLFSKYIIETLGILTALGILGIDLTLIATSLGIVGIAVGFAARDLLSNLLSGIFILFDRVYLVNDAVEIDGTYGIVRLITLRNTEIRTFDGNIVVIPNSKVASGKIVNMTGGSNYMISVIAVNLSYDEDYPNVKKIMREAAINIDGVIAENEQDIRFRVDALEERLQGVEVEMYFTVESRQEPWIKANVYEAVIQALVKNKVRFHRQAPNTETEYISPG